MRKPFTLLTRARFVGTGLITAAMVLTALPTAVGQTAARAQPGVGAWLRPVAGRPALGQAAGALRQELALTQADDLRLVDAFTDELGQVHQRYQQYYQGVKVEHGRVTLHARDGRAELLSGEVGRAAGQTVQPSLGEAAALQRALQVVGARQYKWQLPGEEQALRAQTGNARASYQPKGELVLVDDYRQPEAGRGLVLAWKFNVYAHQPLSRDWLYIDARTGQLVLRTPIIKHLDATGAGDTRYLGRRTVYADQFGGGYRLREAVHGKGVVTLNMKKGTSYAAAVDFVDNDNNWSAAEYDNANYDNAALDAHIGAQVTQDYWTSIHNRDSFDDKGSVLYSYVHYSTGYENAYWDGLRMTYGDGASSFKPLTAVDVCGHEIGHAVCESTANLAYQNESGGMNEGFSDIWGACVENHLDPTKGIWRIGEDIMRNGTELRSMSNPNAHGQPDTYKGTYWVASTATPTSSNDYGGVHTNSGVLNYWFYLLSVGGSGTNDHGYTFNVPGITMAKAAKIAYRAERVYLSANSTYSNARQATLQAAVDLYGLGSAEVTAVARAWRAVGVEQTEAAPSITGLSASSGVPGDVLTITGTNYGSAYQVRFNGTNAVAATYSSLTSLAVTVPAGATTGPVALTTVTGTATTAGSFTILSPGPAPTLSSYSPAAGAVQGAGVTLSGTNLTGVTSVKVSGVAAAFTVVNATTITLTVPTAGSGPLSVSSPAGSASIPFTVLPALTAFSPLSGAVGTTVTLVGTNLANTLNVKFNGAYASSVAVVNATTVQAQVPLGAGSGPLTLRTADGTATAPVDFVVASALAINSFSPVSGPVGTSITLLGQGFTGTSAVRIAGTAATTFTVASDAELWVTVPAGARSGAISLTTPQGSITSSQLFEVTGTAGAPTITSFSPGSGPVGTTVTIQGSLSGVTAVTFNGTAAAFSFQGMRINATVPAGATSGRITVANAAATALSGTDFFITPANDLLANAIAVGCGSRTLGNTAGSTHTGDPGTACSGASLSASTLGVWYKFVGQGGSVTMNTCPNASYDGQLAVYSGPANATAGSQLSCVAGDDDGCGSASGSRVTFTATSGTTYYIYVTGFEAAVGAFELAVNCASSPAVTAMNPTSGPRGTVVTLTGTNLGSTSGVTFNGVAASNVTASATQVTATVPPTATSGPITLLTGLGNTVAPSFFTVTPGLNAFSPAAGPAGTAVVLTGSFFDGVSGVRFNGTDAASFTINSASQLTAVVPAGATTGPISVLVPGGASVTVASFEVLGIFSATRNQCLSTPAVTSTGSGQWQWLRAANGDLVAAINDQGVALGPVSVEVFLNQGALRTDAGGVEYLNRNWHLTAQNAFAGQRVRVRFYVPDAELATYVAGNDNDASDVSTADDLRLTQYQGPGEDCALTNNSGPDYRLLTPGVQRVTNAGWFALETEVADHFSEFHAHGGNLLPLPVTLTAFTATATAAGSGVQLRWTTAQERNSASFVVERSLDGRTFAALGRVAAAGNSTAPRSYQLTDAALPAGAPTLYYRLQQLDQDGTFAHSVVQVVRVGPAAALALLPNPTSGAATLRGALPHALVQVLDLRGRRVLSATADAAGTARLVLPAHLPAGVYIVRSGAQAARLVKQ
ncbi:M4 family metallopeptidase [Hymenobacter edaphi]|uniref:IPT/TIG domain-containing protein n=1 Tax=Hymenobacter edaphi TaxID=2211146 RepID=A0A328BFZ1_9BACT|nr:M4 family metallopeptidase [Hymenobacter edaphi]RAK64048.1 hypothetical protein DLM85_19075 [Hymenobacter edaphi]